MSPLTGLDLILLGSSSFRSTYRRFRLFGEYDGQAGINSLLAEARAGNVDMIVVYKLDRLSRSLRQFYGLWEELRRHNVNFASATQQIDTATPHGMLFLNMLLSFAEFEREQTSERTRHKLIQRAQQGKWNGGWVPTGYDYDKKNQKLILKSAEQELVAKAFNEAVQLKNPTAVAKYLTDGVADTEANHRPTRYELGTPLHPHGHPLCQVGCATIHRPSVPVSGSRLP